MHPQIHHSSLGVGLCLQRKKRLREWIQQHQQHPRGLPLGILPRPRQWLRRLVELYQDNLLTPHSLAPRLLAVLII